MNTTRAFVWSLWLCTWHTIEGQKRVQKEDRYTEETSSPKTTFSFRLTQKLPHLTASLGFCLCTISRNKTFYLKIKTPQTLEWRSSDSPVTGIRASRRLGLIVNWHLISWGTGSMCKNSCRLLIGLPFKPCVMMLSRIWFIFIEYGYSWPRQRKTRIDTSNWLVLGAVHCHLSLCPLRKGRERVIKAKRKVLPETYIFCFGI